MKKSILILIIVTCWLARIAVSQDTTTTWHTIGNMPAPVWGGEAVVVDSMVYILGGFSDSLNQTTNWIQSYNLYSKQWRQVGHLRAHRRGLVADTYNRKSYVYGGNYSNRFDSNAVIEVFDPQNPAGTAPYDTNQNLARYYSAGLIVNGNYFIFGGYLFHGNTMVALPYLAVYNIPGHEFVYKDSTLLNPLPWGQMIANIDDNIFLFGGSSNGVTKKIYKFNTASHGFAQLSTQLTSNRVSGRAERIPNTSKIIIIGGNGEGPNQYALQTTEVFEVKSGGTIYSIRPGPMMAVARTQFMSVVWRNYIYIFGGYNQFGQPVEEIERISFDDTTDVFNDNPGFPKEVELGQNYPNPFNPSTVIYYSLSATQSVSLSVFDIYGKEIATLVHGRVEAGNHSITWNATEFPSGIYFYRLSSAHFTETKKMLLVK